MNAELIDQLAQIIHERYVALAVEQGSTGGRPLASRSWQDLSEVDREPSRAQARDIPLKLLALGLEPVPAGAPGSAPLVVDDSLVERLAESEHRRWMQQRTTAGWTYAPVRDDGAKHHPLLVPYSDLPEAQKDHDRQPIRLLPELLRAAGLHVRPLAAAG